MESMCNFVLHTWVLVIVLGVHTDGCEQEERSAYASRKVHGHVQHISLLRAKLQLTALRV